MQPVVIDKFDNAFGAPPDWKGEQVECMPLAYRLIDTPEGKFYVSAWMPDAEDLAAINRGEPLNLWVRGPGHPVVAMTTGPVDHGL